MFGVLRGAGCGLASEDQQEWMGHLCGVCLALRNRAGHLSRLATNFDAALLSVLHTAQIADSPERYTSHCPLRSHFKADVTPPDSASARFGASIALAIAATKIHDHLNDDETVWRHVPALARGVARKWANQGRQMAAELGFATETIEAQTSRQSQVEARPERDFFYYSQPTELAVAAAFQQTAIIANRPQNAPFLFEMGRMFGRIMLLLDSYQDFEADRRAQRFNPLAACFPEAEMPAQANRLFGDAHRRLKDHFKQLALPRPDLAAKLLIHQLNRRGQQILQPAAGISCSPSLREFADFPGVEVGVTSRPRMRIVSERLLSVVSRQRQKKEEQHKGCDFFCCDVCFCCGDCDDGCCDGCCCDCGEGSNCDCGDGCCCDCNCN